MDDRIADKDARRPAEVDADDLERIEAESEPAVAKDREASDPQAPAPDRKG